MKDSNNNASNFALMHKAKWLLDIPCSILSIQILNKITHLKTEMS